MLMNLGHDLSMSAGPLVTSVIRAAHRSHPWYPMSASQEVLDYVAKLTPTAHAVFFYDADKVAAEVFAAFVNGGVERKQTTYFVSPSREVYTHLLELGRVKIDELEKAGHLNHISSAEFYFDGGRLSCKKVLENAQILIRRTHESGFKAMRLISMADWASLPTSVSAPDVAAYERAIGKICPPEMSAICSYNARKSIDRGGHEFFIDLLQAHGDIVFKGLASKT